MQTDMKIEILGTGCPNCHALEANVREALTVMQVKANIAAVTSLPEILAYDVLSMPALVVNGKVAVSGKVPDVLELKRILSDEYA